MSSAQLHKGKYANLSADALNSALVGEGYSVFSWQDTPGTTYSAHSHSHDEFIVVHAGTIDFIIDGVRYSMAPGDALRLAAHTVHAAENKGNETVRYFICS